MKRICSIAYVYYKSDSRVRRMCEALAARGDEVECICLRREDEPAEEEIAGVRVIHVRQRKYRGRSKARYILAYLRFALSCLLLVTRRHLRRRYDVVHANNMPNFIVFAGLVPRITGSRVILDIHDLMPELFATKFAGRGFLSHVLLWEERLSASLARFALCADKTQRERLMERRFSPGKLAVIHNLPDGRIWRVAPVEKATSVGKGGFRMVYHGTLARRLGLHTVIRALAILEDRLPGLSLELIGEGDACEELQRLAESLGVSRRLRMTGRAVPLTDLPAMIRTADLGIVPIQAEWMLPVKLMEFVAMGVPTIVSRTRTISRYFTDDMVHFVTPGDVHELARAIRELVDDPDKRTRLAENARRFLGKHSWAEEKELYFARVDGRR